MTQEQPKWSFVVRDKKDGHAVLTSAKNMLWFGSGENKTAAKKDAIQHASKFSGINPKRLFSAGVGIAENRAAEHLDYTERNST